MTFLGIRQKVVGSSDEIPTNFFFPTKRYRQTVVVSSSLDVFDVVDASLLTSIDHSLKLDNGAYAKINSMIIPCCEDFDRSQEWINLCVQHPGKDQMTYQALSPLRNLESQHLRLAERASRWETVEAG
ncbi:hypothetical protein F2Q68_00034627 [Brassica cretica]|uniref:Uncharacterized protein n=1 Tax=Brassica cretica TaxID=69181 RepID=A0A8S9H8X1_BRACR|nr:hypothetical protein F2Q68_00034627 [Brassica cretica]